MSTHKMISSYKCTCLSFRSILDFLCASACFHTYVEFVWFVWSSVLVQGIALKESSPECCIVY